MASKIFIEFRKKLTNFEASTANLIETDDAKKRTINCS